MIYGIVLAAGMGRRLGIPKGLATLEGRSFLDRAIRCFRDVPCEVLVVVNSEIAARLPAPVKGEERIMNLDPDHESGMFGSVRLGVARARALGANGVVLLPVDHPLVLSADVRAVADEVRQGAAVAVATYRSGRGHPVGLSSGVMEEVLAAPRAGTLKDIVRSDPGRVIDVPGSRGVIEGVNTREDLARVSKLTFR